MKARKSAAAKASGRLEDNWRQVERRQWWLSLSSIVLSLVLTVGISLLAIPLFSLEFKAYGAPDKDVLVHALVGLVLLFDLYVVFQQLQIYRARKHTAEREELFKLISENVADLIAVVSVGGKRAYNSPSYERVLGYSTEELQKTSAFEQIHPDDRAKVMEAAEEAKRTGHGRSVEYRIRHKYGNWITLESTASVVRDGQGKIEKLVIVNRDITERKQLEEQLRLSQKIEAIGRLSGGIAHDFNNLLGVIIGYTEALQKRLKPDDPSREAIDEIQRAGKRAASLTQQLLAFSRKQVLAPSILDMNEIAREAEKMLGRLIGEHIQLLLVLADSLGQVKADRTQIEQVILNLAVNARDAMPQGGKLTIETANVEWREADPARPRYLAPGSYVELKVTDTGGGMSPEVQAHIFEPFFTTKEKGKGTGLGLATVYGVIKQSGGYILVQSEVGKGTAFEVYLPRVAAAPENTNVQRPSAKKFEKRHAVVLLVEDESSLRTLTRNVLQAEGCTVLEAADAVQALDIAKRTEGTIDLLLTDVIMPGMSGCALAASLSSARPGMRVLYMSGYTDGELTTQGVLNPGTSILHKPFTHEELLRRAEETLSGVEGKQERPLDMVQR
jgi:two-component system, cell cycle sensor histidine kinase and response regulator CckA